jgi:plastocyanin
MAGESTYLHSDGKAVTVDLLYTVGKGQVAVVDGWLGIAGSSGDSGDSVALAVDDREYQFTVPANLSVSKGDIVYIEVADLTGHVPDDTAYSTTAGSGKVAFFKATMDKNTDNVVTGIMLARNALAS